MSKKKMILTVAAVAMICAVAIVGTLAFLNNQTKGVTNTFTAGAGLISGPAESNYFIDEHGVVLQSDGTYSFTSSLTSGNSYELYPGATLPKDAKVHLTNKTNVPAYLYVEVVNTGCTSDNGLTFAVEDCWKELKGVTGAKGGKVYVYAPGGTAKQVTAADSAAIAGLNILKNNKVTVAGDKDYTSLSSDYGLTFYSYLAQATAGTGADTPEQLAYTTCFSGN